MKKSRSGFTLVELLLAMTLVIILGMFLIQILRGIFQTWGKIEEQRVVLENARDVLECIKDDIQSLYCHDQNRGLARFVLDFDSYGRQQLRFMRWAKNSALTESIAGHYGIAEVMYLTSANKDTFSLYRGLRCPPGGQFSCWNDNNLNNMTGRKKWIQDYCQEWSDHILLCWFDCWKEGISSWKNAPNTWLFDSSIKSSLPLKLRVTLVITGDSCASAILSQDINAQDTSLTLMRPKNFPVLSSSYNYIARVGNEWIRYKNCTGNQITQIIRGQYNTDPQEHKRGTKIVWGVCFIMTISLPDYVTSWN